MDTLRKCLVAVILALSIPVIAADAININTADKETLMSLNGVGEKLAVAIIEYREKNGPFKSIDQLTEIKGVGQYVVDNNRKMLAVKDRN